MDEQAVAHIHFTQSRSVQIMHQIDVMMDIGSKLAIKCRQSRSDGDRRACYIAMELLRSTSCWDLILSQEVLTKSPTRIVFSIAWSRMSTIYLDVNVTSLCKTPLLLTKRLQCRITWKRRLKLSCGTNSGRETHRILIRLREFGRNCRDSVHLEVNLAFHTALLKTELSYSSTVSPLTIAANIWNQWKGEWGGTPEERLLGYKPLTYVLVLLFAFFVLLSHW